MSVSLSAISPGPDSSSPEARRTVRLQGFAARVVGPPAVLDELAGLFPAQPAGGDRGEERWDTHLAVRPHAGIADRFQVLRDDVVLTEAATRDELLPYLEWAIATAGVEYLGRDHLLFHAGAVAMGGRGILLPGPSGSGKSTLVAGLMRSGFRYLSDEVAVVDPVTGDLLPFAKSLCVKAGAQPVLAPLYPQLAGARLRHRFGPELVTFLPPPSGSWAMGPSPLRFVVLPRYVAGAATRLDPIRRSQAAVALLEQSFNARSGGPTAVARTVELVRPTACFTLTMGDLPGAVRVLRELVAT
jgi:hypothetical protein